MDLKGTVVKIYPKKQVSEKFAFRQFVIKTNDQYPQEIIMQVTQERCSLLDNIIEGEEIQAFINIRGRAWINPEGEAKYFNTIEVWKISNETLGSSQGLPQNDKSGIANNFVEDAINDLPSQDDDLPF